MVEQQRPNIFYLSRSLFVRPIKLEFLRDGNKINVVIRYFHHYYNHES